jgi:Sensors of blue-light using FAD
MKLIRLTYFSRSCIEPDDRERCVKEIIATATANNRRDGVTGGLIFDDQWFVQELEGTESKVSATFERILRDRRHRNVSLVTMLAVTERRYPAFAMACIPRDQDNNDLFRHYGEDALFDPRQMRGDRLSDLIEAVMQRAVIEQET